MEEYIPGSVVEDDCLVVLLDAVLLLNELQPLLRGSVEAYFVSSCTRQPTRIRWTMWADGEALSSYPRMERCLPSSLLAFLGSSSTIFCLCCFSKIIRTCTGGGAACQNPSPVVYIRADLSLEAMPHTNPRLKICVRAVTYLLLQRGVCVPELPLSGFLLLEVAWGHK